MRSLGRHCIAEERGSALLELLLYLTVFSFLLPVIAESLAAVTQIWSRAVNRMEAREQAVLLLRRIEGEVREGGDFAVQSDRFSFLDQNGRWVQYQLGTGGILLRNTASGTTVIAANVESCQFSLEANGTIIHLLLTTKVGQAEETVDQVWTGRGSLP